VSVSLGEITATIALKHQLQQQLRAATEPIKQAEKALEELSTSAIGAGKGFDALGKEAADAGKQIKSMDLKSIETSMRNLGSTLTSFGRSLTIGVTAPILAVGAASIKMAMDAVESENLFEVSFGNMADAARRWSKETSDALGLNEFELRRTSATIFTMVESMGLGKDAAFQMATGMSELAADMASFFNLKPEEAFEKLRSGIVGETEPLRRLGILVDEATVKTAAYKHGIAEMGSELTQQEKVQARWAAILDQTTKAQGDLARTLDSPTNQLRIMKERGAELAVTFGMSLMPVFKDALEIVGRIAPVIERAVKWFSDLPGPVRAGAVAIGLLAAAAGPLLIAVGSILGNVALLIPLFASGLPTAAGTSALSINALTAAVGRLKAAFVGFALNPFTVGLAAAGTAALILRHELDEGTAALRRRIQANKDHDTIQNGINNSTKLTVEQQAEVKAALERTSKAFDKTGADVNKLNATFGAVKLNGEQLKAALGSDLTAQLDKARKAMANLTDEQRRQITAGKELGLTTKEIAEQMGVAENVIGLYVDSTKNLKTVGAEFENIKEQQAQAIIEAQAWSQFMGGDAMAKPISLQEQYYEILTAVIARFGSLKSAGLSSLQAIFDKLDQSPFGRLTQLQKEFAGLVSPLKPSTIGFSLDIGARGYAETQALARQNADAIAALTLTSFDYERRLILTRTQLAKDGYDKSLGFAAEYYAQLDAIAARELADVGLRESLSGTASGAFANIADMMSGGQGMNPRAARGLTERLFGMSMSDLGQEMAGTLMAAFTGGGNAVLSLGAKLGQSLGGRLAESLGDKVGDSGKLIEGGLTKVLGKSLGGAISSMLPGIGSLLGPLLVKGVSFITDKFFGGEGKKVNDIRDAFLQSQGGAEELHKKLAQIGRLDLWAPLVSGPGRLDAINEAVREVEGAFRDSEAAAERVAEVMGRIQGKFNELMGATEAYGQRAPVELHGVIDELLEMNGLTAEQIRLLKDLKAAPDWQSMEEAAGRLGVALGNLGPAFQQGKLSDAALGVVRDLKLLEQGGANMTAVLKDAKGKIQELVTTALETGSKLPSTLQPYIQKLIDMELLLDPKGDLIKNIDQLSFADIEDQVLLDIKGILEQIRDLLRNDLPAAASVAQGALNGLHVPDFGAINVPAPGGGYVPGTSDGTGYFPDGSIDPDGPYGYQLDPTRNMATGGMVRATPGGTIVRLGEGGEDEWVIPASKIGGGGDSGSSVYIDLRGALVPDRESMRELAFMLAPHLPDPVRHFKVDRL
jgi:hypothetical protein